LSHSKLTSPMAQTTPQQRSDLARKAAHARWSRTDRHCERSEAISSLSIQNLIHQPGQLRGFQHIQVTGDELCQAAMHRVVRQ